jgi:hypothetical protein
MDLFTIFIVLIVAGVLLWLVQKYVPMNQTIKNILIGVVIVIIAVWLLKGFGVFTFLKGVHI